MRTSAVAVSRCVVLLLALSTALGGDPPKELPLDPATRKYTYQAVVSVEGVPASELYSRAKAWAATVYRSMKDVQQLDDEKAGRLILKGSFSMIWNPPLVKRAVALRHTLTIEVKDGRYRYSLGDFYFVDPGTEGPLEIEPKYGRAKFLTSTVETVGETVADLKAAMAKPEEKW